MTRNAFIKTVTDEALGRVRSAFAATKCIKKANEAGVSYVLEELQLRCPDIDLEILPGLIFPSGINKGISRTWLTLAIKIILDKSEGADCEQGFAPY